MEPVQDTRYLQIDEITKKQLLETVGWTKFISIVGFIFIAFLLLSAIGIVFSANILSTFTGNLPIENMFLMMGGFGFLILFIFILLLYFYPTLLLFRFSLNIKKGIATNNQTLLNKGFKAQKALFRFIGILTILMLIFYLIMMFFSGLAIISGINSL